MNYLLDRKIKRRKIFYIIFFVVALFGLFYFRSGIWSGLSYASHKIFRPVLVLGRNIGGQFRGWGSFFVSKNSLYHENENLKNQLAEDKAMMSNYNFLLTENLNLKEILGRNAQKTNLTLAAILGKPNQSSYDTLIIDAGIQQGIKIGDIVFALGHGLTGEISGTVPIGRVSDVYNNSSKVILFSNSGEKTQVIVGDRNVFLEVVGRGGGNFEMVLPRDFTLIKGDQVILPGIMPYVLGIVETILSDPRDPFIKALLISPVNIQEIKFVQVEVSAR